MSIGPVSFTNNLIQSQSSFAAQSQSAATENNPNAQIKSSETRKIEKESFWDNLVNKTKQSEIVTRPTETQMMVRLADIKLKGKMLIDHPMPEAVKSYIKDVKDFLNDAREHGYKANFDEERFQKIDIVDEHLDEMAHDLISGQKPQLDLVNSLGRLQGLLIDIFV
ncbi:MAG: YaaR family protein [Candidatus Caenarcaniphilales bacterium]|jgi:uncharacterized protein YaaR (DUF327 family)|nr:YaaR family protein [Candidatus Caenarcaniphilales bacterium]